ncbi:MAG: helix-turn-helix transcriptional regulator [Solirubrobacteraceae bacterium]
MAVDTQARLDTSYHKRRLAERLAEDAVFRAEFERQSREIAQIDAIVNQLDSLREQNGLTKAELARLIDKNPASIRRLLTAPVNPELRTLVAIADALGAEVRVVPRKPVRAPRAA